MFFHSLYLHSEPRDLHSIGYFLHSLISLFAQYRLYMLGYISSLLSLINVIIIFNPIFFYRIWVSIYEKLSKSEIGPS